MLNAVIKQYQESKKYIYLYMYLILIFISIGRTSQFGGFPYYQ